MEHSADRLRDAARVRRVREELDDALRAGLDAPGFTGVDAIESYLATGRVTQAREALQRLKEKSGC